MGGTAAGLAEILEERLEIERRVAQPDVAPARDRAAVAHQAITRESLPQKNAETLAQAHRIFAVVVGGGVQSVTLAKGAVIIMGLHPASVPLTPGFVIRRQREHGGRERAAKQRLLAALRRRPFAGQREGRQQNCWQQHSRKQASTCHHHCLLGATLPAAQDRVTFRLTGVAAPL